MSILQESDFSLRVQELIDTHIYEVSSPECCPSPMVSVALVAFNHKQYINQSLESILAQETNFTYEIVISDDCSTDGTTDILRDYQVRYPGKIRLILAKRNLWQVLPGMATSPTCNIAILGACQGKYIALCEGDDYWTDPLKLQKQVDFLEANPDYSLVAHPTQVLEANTGEFLEGGIIGYISNNETQSRDWSVLEWPTFRLPTASLVLRATVIRKYQEISPIHSSDMLIVYTAASVGKIRCFSEAMSVYRIHDGGMWSNNTNSYRSIFFIQSIDAIIASNLSEEVGATDWLKVLFDYNIFKLACEFDKNVDFWDFLEENISCDLEKLTRNKWLITTTCNAILEKNALLKKTRDSYSFKLGNLIVNVAKKLFPIKFL